MWLKLIRGGHLDFHSVSVAPQRAAGFVLEKQVHIRFVFYYQVRHQVQEELHAPYTFKSLLKTMPCQSHIKPWTWKLSGPLNIVSWTTKLVFNPLQIFLRRIRFKDEWNDKENDKFEENATLQMICFKIAIQGSLVGKKKLRQSRITEARATLNCWSACLGLPTAGTIGVQHCRHRTVDMKNGNKPACRNSIFKMMERTW